MLKIEEVTFSEEANAVYTFLKSRASQSKEERVLFNAIEKKKQIIFVNPHYGDLIAKRLIPKEYKKKYNITTLFRVELPFFWRMLYTITDKTHELKVVAFVLDIIDHKQYNKKFGYRSE